MTVVPDTKKRAAPIKTVARHDPPHKKARTATIPATKLDMTPEEYETYLKNKLHNSESLPTELPIKKL